MIGVRFIRTHRGYNIGEKAGFDEAVARDLVDRGFAVYTKPAPGLGESDPEKTPAVDKMVSDTRGQKRRARATRSISIGPDGDTDAD